jgi:hypothetical protein
VKHKTRGIALLALAVIAIAVALHPRPSPRNAGSDATSTPSQPAAPIAAAIQDQSSVNSPAMPSRAVDPFTYSGSEDYSALKLHYQAAADAGDPSARRIIAQIYDYCARYSNSPKKFGQYLDVLATTRPEWRAQMQAIKAETAKRCAGLDGGTAIPPELVEFDWAQALASRDPVATLQIAARQSDLSGAQLDQLLGRVLLSADPETLFEVGNLISSNQGSTRYAKFSDPYLGPYAWQVLACRRGGPAMCGPNSPLVMMHCMAGICTGGTDYEHLIRATLSAIDQARLDKQVAELDRFLSGGG